MAQKQKLYFAYGSNLLRKQMAIRCPDAVYIGLACAKGWRFEYDGGPGEGWGDKPVGNIIPAKRQRVWGALYSINNRDLKVLDDFEVVPTKYKHHLIQVTTPNGSNLKAFAYVRPAQPIGPPAQKYERVVVLGAVEDGLPSDYIRHVLATVT